MLRSFIRKLLCLLGLCLVLSVSVSAFAEEMLAPGSISIRADSLTYEKETDSYHAAGNVRIEKGGMILTSDTASLVQSTSMATASGNIVMTQEGTVIYGDRLVINLDTGKGDITNGHIYMDKGNVYLTGERIYKVGDKDFHLEQATITTCETKPPSWKFTAPEMDVTREEYATSYHTLFYLDEIPVLYTPAFLFPVKNERQSGFLTSRFGTSNKKGFNLVVPYYWAISPSQDATITLDYEAKRGTGIGTDYRYIRTTGSAGFVRGFAIYDTNKDQFRGELAQRHLEVISPSSVFKTDINLVTDRDFFRDYGEESGIYNKQILESSVSYTKNWALYSLVADFRYTQDLDSEYGNRMTLQRLPTVTFTGVKQKVFNDSQLYFSFDSNFTYFQRDEELNKNNEPVQGTIGERLTVDPKLSYIFRPGRIVDITPWVSYQQRFYDAYGGKQGDGFHGIGIPMAGAVASTTISKVYDVHVGDLQKVRHAMMPEINYTLVPRIDQGNLPKFDSLDRVAHQNMVYYSLANYLTAKYQKDKENPTYQDLVYFKLTQGYELSGNRYSTVTDEICTGVGNTTRPCKSRYSAPFTDIMFESRITPVDKTMLAVDWSFNPYDGVFSSFVASGNFRDRWDDTMSFGYHYTRDQVDYLEGKFELPYFKPIILSYKGRYTYSSHDFLENLYTVEYRHQCWSVLFSYRNRIDNKEFLIGFTLYGLGPLGSVQVF